MTQDSSERGLAELLAALDAVAPELEATAREAEELRRAPEALAEVMRRARISMAKVPREIGGFELLPVEQVEYFARVAYLNPTAGWLGFNQAGALGMLGANLGDPGVELVFADPAPAVAAVSAPTGHSRRQSGGYSVTGRWAYASGAAASEWTLLTTVCDDPPGLLAVLIPTPEVTLHDDWHVAALQGSGSVDVSVEDHFVPDALTFTPFAAQRRGGLFFASLGYKVYVAGESMGFSLGVAQRLVDEVAGLARNKRRVLDTQTVGERGAFQMELGRCDLTLRAARALVVDELGRIQDVVLETKGAPPERDRLRMEGALAHATEMLVQATTRLFPFAGAGALHLSSPIQRAYRDLVGSGQHYVVSNLQVEDWGKALLEAGGG